MKERALTTLITSSPTMCHILLKKPVLKPSGPGLETYVPHSLWFDNWHPHSPLAGSYGERFIYDSGMEKNATVNVLIHNLEWKIPTTQAIGWHPIVEVIPSDSNPKMGKTDEIVWLDSPNHRFSVKVAWEQLRIHRQMVEWHDIM